MKRYLSLVALAFATCAHSDEVKVWNSVTLDLIRSQGVPPPKASRLLAMVSVASADAVNATHRLCVGKYYNAVSGPGASADVAAAKAAHDVLLSVFPGQSASLAAKLAASTASYGGNALNNGLQAGQAAASACLAGRAADQSGLASPPYTGSNAIGRWRPTPNGFANGLLPEWGKVTPFSIASGDQFRPPAPPSPGSPDYVADFDEVKALGSATSSTRTQDQTDIARFWADGGGTFTPPGHWNEIANRVADQLSYSIDERSRMLGMLNMGLADAGIAAWEAKYFYEYWRPITAIREGDADGNAATAGDAGWSPLIATPPFPSYVSGHSTFSAAAARILAGVVGTDAVNFSTTNDSGDTRSYSSFLEAAEEAGQSRIYGGIHFQFDNTAGLAMGAGIGDVVLANEYAPVPEPASSMVLAGALMALGHRRRKGTD